MFAGFALGLFFPAIVLLILFTILLMILEKKSFSLLNVYLTLVSFVSLIGMVIGFGVALQQIVSASIITNNK